MPKHGRMDKICYVVKTLSKKGSEFPCRHLQE